MSPRLGLAVVAITQGCAWSCTPPSPNVVAPTIDTVVCILGEVAKDEHAGMSWPATLLDTAAVCGADTATIATVWSSHVHAMAIDPSPKAVPPPDGGQ